MSHTQKPRFVSWKLFCTATVLAAAAALSACNTTEGVGKDIKSVGRGIESSAEKNK